MHPIVDMIIAIAGGIFTVLSWRAVAEAERTGRLRLFFWHIEGWGERERNPGFFRASLRMQYVRTIFFALVTLIAGAAFAHDVGTLISNLANGG